MAKSALVFRQGKPSFDRWASGVPKKLKAAITLAVEECLLLLQEEAMNILREEIYNKDRSPYEKELTEELLHSWKHELRNIAYGVLGKLTNTSDHAIYLEMGTIAHDITARAAEYSGRGRRKKGAKTLHFLNLEGKDVFPVTIHHPGIKPMLFMEKAIFRLSVNRGPNTIEYVFAKRIREAIDSS